MTAYVALLRAVNVGGTGKLPMTALKSMCEEASFSKVRTFIASGNVVFTSDLPEAKVKVALEAALAAYAKKPVGVLVRTAAEMSAILKANPFKSTAANHTVTIFLDTAPPADALGVVGQATEEIRIGRRELYVHYPDGQGRSKLKIKAAANGTARNMNTVTKLTAMAKAL